MTELWIKIKEINKYIVDDGRQITHFQRSEFINMKAEKSRMNFVVLD